MKIVVTQFWTKNLSYSKYTKSINEKYCNEQSYDYYVEDDDNVILEKLDKRAFTWYKPSLILDTLEKFNPDYVLFLDADAIIVDHEQRIEQFIEDGKDIVCTMDYGPSVMNAGVILFKNTEWVKNFLKEWDKSSYEFSGGPNNEKGYYKNALWHDQTCFGILYNEMEGAKDKIEIIDNKVFNSRYFKDTQHDNFIFHAFSYGMLPNRTIDSAYYNIMNEELPKGEQLIDIIGYYSTDKHYEHNFIKIIYNDLFRPIKNEVKQFVEIGVFNCESIKLWRDYFTNANIIGIDNNLEECLKHMEGHSMDRLTFHNMDQSVDEEMEKLSEMYQNVDVIMEDGSHMMRDQQMTFAKIFKMLKSGGIYILEDLHTSIELIDKPNHWITWGDRDKTITLNMLEDFKKTGKIVSDYMTEEEMNYLNENIETVEIYRNRPDWSVTSVIIKK